MEHVSPIVIMRIMPVIVQGKQEGHMIPTQREKQEFVMEESQEILLVP